MKTLTSRSDEERNRTSAPPRREGMVCVVDDDLPIGQTAALVLEAAGIECRYYDDPARALEALESDASPPALLMTDFDMPGMNGMELATRVRNRFPDLPVLLVSGSLRPDILKRVPLQPDAFLPKPYTAEQLLLAVDALLLA